MAEMSGTSNDNQVDAFDNEEENSDFYMSDEEEEDDDWDGFDVSEDQNYNFEISEHSNVEEITTTLSEIELAEEPTAPTTFENFTTLPEEIQMSIWKFCAHSVRRTIVMKLERTRFHFATCPSTPAFMHACHRARMYGLEVYKAVDWLGVPHDINNPHTFHKFYFYANPISDDFILRFGEEKNCPKPVYCPIESSSSYMTNDLTNAEERLRIQQQELIERRNARILNVPAYLWLFWLTYQ